MDPGLLFRRYFLYNNILALERSRVTCSIKIKIKIIVASKQAHVSVSEFLLYSVRNAYPGRGGPVIGGVTVPGREIMFDALLAKPQAV